MIVYSSQGDVLLLKRALPFEFWQSITGSLFCGETHFDAAVRELHEETGLGLDDCELTFSGNERVFIIDPRWRDRYAPGVIENLEYEWHCRVDRPRPVRLHREEHSEYCWAPIAEAIESVWSWTNRDALVALKDSL